MKIRILLPLLAALTLLGAVGCSGGEAKATPAEEKAFAGGPPPANYMEGINKSAPAPPGAAQGKNGGQ